MALKYNPVKPYTFKHRLDMCRAVGETEGTELGDAISALVTAIIILSGIGDDFHAEASLLLAENLCRGYVKDWLWARQSSWEEYEQMDAEVFAHFTGGATKMTKEQFSN